MGGIIPQANGQVKEFTPCRTTPTPDESSSTTLPTAFSFDLRSA